VRGNLDGKYEGNVLTYDYSFDVEGRLASVRTSNQTTTFAYDADGQRVLTTRPDGVLIYTPFPDYEMEDPPGAGGLVSDSP
jgi:YD repeat-containing protein